MRAIFLSYRRADSQDVTGRIYDRLVSKYTSKRIFKDVDNIPLGVSFPMHIRQMLDKASAVLVIIGPTWVNATDEQGKRRLEDPNDFVRVEVEVALRKGMPVIPVLVSNARMPKTIELPPSMHKLLERNGIAVRPDPDFNNDITRVFAGLDHLEKLLNLQPGQATPERNRGVLPAESMRPAAQAPESVEVKVAQVGGVTDSRQKPQGGTPGDRTASRTEAKEQPFLRLRTQPLLAVARCYPWPLAGLVVLGLLVAVWLLLAQFGNSPGLGTDSSEAKDESAPEAPWQLELTPGKGQNRMHKAKRHH